MKFPSLVLAALLILCGCAAPPESATEPPTTIPIPVTEPVCLYDAQSEIEKQTDGAIKACPLDGADAEGIMVMGSHVVLFSGHDTTTLTLYSGETLCLGASITLDCKISPDDAAVQVSELGISYYDDWLRSSRDFR